MTRKTHIVFRAMLIVITNQMEREQGESCFWARIIMHMRNMHISIIMLLAVTIRFMTRLLSLRLPAL